ncbi:MAG: hypothetical protein ACPGO0_04600 [Acidimicrobiales bacterium]
MPTVKKKLFSLQAFKRCPNKGLGILAFIGADDGNFHIERFGA